EWCGASRNSTQVPRFNRGHRLECSISAAPGRQVVETPSGTFRSGPPLAGTLDEWSAVPEPWRGEVAARLEAGESVLAWFAPDLDTRLHYAEGLVVLTDRRVLSGDPGPSPRRGPEARGWRSWPL